MSEFSSLRYIDELPKKEKILRLVWNTVWLLLFRPTPRWAFNYWRILLLKIFGAKIGSGSKVSPSCFVWAPWNLVMGEYTVLGDGVDCYTMDKIIIGSKVAVSQRTFLCTGSHDITSLRRPLITRPILIEDHVWVCAEAFVGPGVTLSNNSVVAARAVAVKDTSAFDIVAGNPARKVGTRKIESNHEN